MDRAEILDAAKAHVTQDRAALHGEMEDSFTTIATLWSGYLGAPIRPHEVAVMMTLLKIARTRNNPAHMDSWIDAAGYMACGGSMFGSEVQG